MLSEKKSIQAELKEIFSETSMEFAQTKNSRAIVIVFDLQEKKNEGSPEIFECFNVKLLKRRLFRKYFGRGILRIGFLKLAQLPFGVGSGASPVNSAKEIEETK